MRLAAARLLQTCAAPASRATRRTRGLHYLRQLPYDIEKGLGSFLPPDALKVVAVDYQGGLLERLNNLVRGTPYEALSLVQTVISSASSPDDIDIFNTASEALNNDFFLENLRPPEHDEEKMVAQREDFWRFLRASFGTLENLKSVVSATAMGMTSSGWVWLVADGRGDLAALPTFGAGTIILKHRIQNNGVVALGRQNRAQPASRPAPSPRGAPRPSPASGTLHVSDPQGPPRGSRTLHTSLVAPAVTGFGSTVRDGEPYGRVQSTRQYPYASEHDKQQGSTRLRASEELTPLFCISVHEHAWMAAGLGVWGKEEYLRRFWTAVDWPKVMNYFDPPDSLSSISHQ